MSYILDALRRAEAQRTRGRLPGLHQVAGGAAVPAPAGGSRRWLPMILLLLAAMLAVGVIVLRGTAGGSDPIAGPTQQTDPPASGATAGRGVAAAAASPAGTASAAEPPLLALPRQAVLAEQAMAPAARPAEPPTAPTARAAAPSGAQPAASAARLATPDGQQSGQPPGPRLAAATELPSRRELPPDIQRSLPAIVVSGTVYSADPAQRMLVVNGELWREGHQIGPELVLEQIRPRDAVLRFRGLRFTVSP